jgi:hypothetical protein
VSVTPERLNFKPIFQSSTFGCATWCTEDEYFTLCGKCTTTLTEVVEDRTCHVAAQVSAGKA